SDFSLVCAAASSRPFFVVCFTSAAASLADATARSTCWPTVALSLREQAASASSAANAAQELSVFMVDPFIALICLYEAQRPPCVGHGRLVVSDKSDARAASTIDRTAPCTSHLGDTSMQTLADLKNHQIRLASRPVGLPTRDNWSFTPESVGEPADGAVLVKTLFLSLDPAMRGWMNDVKSYIPPVGIGEVMRAGGIVVVVASKNPAFAVGDHVSAGLVVQEYCLIPH